MSERLGIMAALDAARQGKWVFPVTADGKPHGYVGDYVTNKLADIELQDSAFDDCHWEVATEDQLRYLEVDFSSKPDSPASYRTRVAARVSDLDVEQEARRLHAAKTYRGTREVSLTELQDLRVDWIVQGLLAKGTLNFMVAKGNVGKTFCYLDMALRVATGMDWHGKEAEQAKVLIFLGEGLHGYGDRIAAWCEQHGKTLDDLADTVRVQDGANLSNYTFLDELRAIVADYQPDVIVFDTWAMSSGVADGNDEAIAGNLLRDVREIAPDACVLFVAHPNKATEDTKAPVLRGTSALYGAADTVMTLWRDDKHDTGLDRDYLAVSTEETHGGKNRNGRRETLHGFYLAESGPSAVFMHDDAKPVSKADAWAKQNMEPGRVYTVDELVEQTGQSRSSVYNYLSTADVVDKPERGSYALAA